MKSSTPLRSGSPGFRARRWTRALVGLLMLPLAAHADPKAKLIFVGWTRDLQHSVWLTVAQPGVWDLKSGQYNQTIDFWTQEKPGLRLSVSTEVSEWGGTQNLFTQITDQYSQYENWVDSADQHPGRPLLPNTRPPDLITPELPRESCRRSASCRHRKASRPNCLRE